MTGDDLIQLAGNLAVNSRLGEHESRHRSATSRAYYGAFHLAAQFLRDCGLRVPRNHTGHQYVYQCLFGCGVAEATNAARDLDELRSDRIVADYDLDDRRYENQVTAEYSVQKAHAIRGLLKLCREPERLHAVQLGLSKLRKI